jgi:hypothetical protein
MSKLQRAWIGMALALASAPCGAAALTLTAVRDNTLFQESGAISDGAGSGVFVGRTLGGLRRRALLRFDLGALPPGTTINSATLSVHVGRTIAGPMLARVHRVSADWGEAGSNSGPLGGGGAAAQTGDATWTHRFYPTQAWTNPGGDFVATASTSEILVDIASYSFPSTAQTVADVQLWVDQPAQNFGWLLMGDESAPPPTAKRLDSREASDANVRPQLVIDYTGAPVFVAPEPVPALDSWALLALALSVAGWALAQRSSLRHY